MDTKDKKPGTLLKEMLYNLTQPTGPATNIREVDFKKDHDDVVGNQTRVKVVKNKMAPPFKLIEFDIMYGEGISKTGEILDLGVKGGLIEKAGSWFSYDSQRIGQGRENAKSFLRDNKEITESIELRIRQNAGLIGDKMLEESDKEIELEVDTP